MKYAARFLIIFFYTLPLFGWEPPPQIMLKGILKTATRQRLTRYPDGTEKRWEEKSVVLISDEPITLSRGIFIGTREPLVQQESIEFVHVAFNEEFKSLLGKSVELHGYLIEPLADFYFVSDIRFHADTVIDLEWQKTHTPETVFYEPSITKLTGILYRKIFPGPPEYSSVENGDIPESSLILVLREPVNVELAEIEDEPFNQTEQGVREIQISFDQDPPEELWNQGITVVGTLYSAQTAHHRRRVLMTVQKWESAKSDVGVSSIQ